MVAHVVEGMSAKERHELLSLAKPVLDREVLSLGAAAQPVLLAGEAPECLATAAKQASAKIIIVGPARYNEVRDFVLGTAVDALIRTATAPILIVKQRPRAPYRRIVVATDFSHASHEALVTAAALFPNSHITLLHTFLTSFPSRLNPDEMKTYALNQAHEGMGKFRATPGTPQLSTPIDERIEEGAPALTIEAVSQELGADLVVLGATGTNSIVHAILGGQVSDIISCMNRDVLVVRQRKSGE